MLCRITGRICGFVCTQIIVVIIVHRQQAAQGGAMKLARENQTGIPSRTVFINDNLPVLRGINSGAVDLIYLDPPFNKGTHFAGQPKGNLVPKSGNRPKKGTIYSFKDTWTLDDDKRQLHYQMARGGNEKRAYYDMVNAIGMAGTRADKAYLIYMGARLFEMKRILKPSGSIYLHCDWTMAHYLRLAMDCIFGRGNFRNEIIWCYPPTGNPPKFGLPRKHDTILFYGKSIAGVWHQPYGEMTAATLRAYSAIDKDGRRYSKAHGGKTYLDEVKGRAFPDWWTDIGAGSHMPHAERTEYPTQKPLKLLERIINASSNEGDFVLDPFCGCATAMLAAEKLGRNWAGIDCSDDAWELLQYRYGREVEGGITGDLRREDNIPRRADGRKMTETEKKRAKAILLAEQNYKCAGCGCEDSPKNYELDRIVPGSDGGEYEEGNLQVLCANCNRRKGNNDDKWFKEQLRREQLTALI